MINQCRKDWYNDWKFGLPFTCHIFKAAPLLRSAAYKGSLFVLFCFRFRQNCLNHSGFLSNIANPVYSRQSCRFLSNPVESCQILLNLSNFVESQILSIMSNSVILVKPCQILLNLVKSCWFVLNHVKFCQSCQILWNLSNPFKSCHTLSNPVKSLFCCCFVFWLS